MSDYFDTPYGALMLDEIEDYEYVIKSLTEFIDAGNSIGPALHNRALAYWEIGQPEEALADFDAAISVLPSSPMPAKLKGMLLHKLGRLPEALASLDVAVSIAPNEATVHRTRAQVRIAADKLEEALADLEYAVRLEPSFKYTVAERDKLQGKLGSENNFLDRERGNS
jgi:tetratricopeptide (TPR) repeat protein